MRLLSDAFGLLRFGSGLRAFLRETVSAEAAKATVRQQMQQRDDVFVAKMARGVFANPQSPYLTLMRAAGCTLGDVTALVGKEGVEGTLRTLLQAGVYVTFDEFKGRAPAIRGSQRFAFRDTDFDNPLVMPHFRSSSGGTRGKPTRILVDLEHLTQSAPHWALWFAAHDLGTRPLVFWTPAHSGVANRHLLAAKCGKRYVKWFVTVRVVTLKDRVVSATVHGLVRRAMGSPPPEFAPVSRASRVGAYLAAMLSRGIMPCIVTSPSEAISACLAMQEQGVSLRGVTFLLGAEPLTQARRDTIEASGAAAVPTYGFSEGGNVGSQCAHPTAVDDVHVSLDAYAIIQRETEREHTTEGSSLLLTSLRPACPKVLLNTEIGDSAVLETRRCGCVFDAVGYFQHLHTIRSFEKLTGFGVTFVGADLFHVIEHVLPQRFGGAVTDYQLVERQDARGVPRYSLFVSPDVGPLDEREVATAFLDALGRRTNHYRYMANLWAQTDVLQVRRERPTLTTRGKMLPFRTLGAS